MTSQERANEFVRDLGETVRKNPISAALIGMGIVWLFAARTRGADALERVSGVADAAQDVWRGAKSSLRSGSEDVQGQVSAASAALRNQGNRLMEGASETGGELAES